MSFENIPAIQRHHIILEVTWTNCPVDVAEEIGEMWVDREFGNDDYYATWDFNQDAESYPLTAQYLKDNGITDEDSVLIHYWW